MRRRPVEDDREQEQRRQADVARHGGPADDRRQCAGGPAEDDVLRRGSLEQQRVDNDVESHRQKRQERGHEIGQEGHHCESDDPQDEAEHERVLRIDLVRRQRPPARTAHDQVNVAIEVAVDRVGRAGGERATDQRPEHEVEARHAARGEEHRRHRRHQQQLDDARLGQRDVGTDTFTQGGGGLRLARVLERCLRRAGAQPRSRSTR